MVTIEKQIEYIGKDGFVKFDNVDEFPALDTNTKEILKKHGVYSNDKSYPFVTTDGKLRKLQGNLVEVGKGIVDDLYCINTSTGEFVGYDPENKEEYVINSSLAKYIETLYVYKMFSREVESGEAFGEYWPNHKKYAQKLKEMLEEVEPNIMEYEIWYVQFHERDLGVI